LSQTVKTKSIAARRLGELAQSLAAVALGGQVHALQRLQRQRVHLAARLAAGRVGRKRPRPRLLSRPSAMMERAELWVQMNRTW
jgi:hypothetical protein